MQDIEPKELKRRLDAGDNLVLVDVREENELELSRLDGILHIPLDEIPVRFGELRTEDEIVVICRSGGRSGMAARFLEQNGFARVWNLRGGMNAYATEADTTLRTY